MDIKISLHVKLPNAYQSKVHMPHTLLRNTLLLKHQKPPTIGVNEKDEFLEWTSEALEDSILLNRLQIRKYFEYLPMQNHRMKFQTL